MVHDLADFAVFAFLQGQGQPSVRALLAVQNAFDGAKADAIHGDAPLQRHQFRRVHFTVHAHAVATHPTGRGQFQAPGQSAVIGQQ